MFTVFGASFTNHLTSILPSVVSNVALYDLDVSISIGGAELYCVMIGTSFVGMFAGLVSVGVLLVATTVGISFILSSLHPVRRSRGNITRVRTIQCFNILTVKETGCIVSLNNVRKVPAPWVRGSCN